MSHRSTCPDPWDAEREGRRAFEYGRGRYANPYDDPRDGCSEAADAWDDGYRRARRQDEERQEEEAAERHRRQRLEEESAAEREWWEQQDHMEASYVPPEPSERDLCASTGHAEYGSDERGRRCYCGQVRYLTEVVN